MCVIWIYVQNSVKHQTAFIFTIPLEEPCLQKRVLYFMEKLSFDYMLDHWFKRWYRVVRGKNRKFWMLLTGVEYQLQTYFCY